MLESDAYEQHDDPLEEWETPEARWKSRSAWTGRERLEASQEVTTTDLKPHEIIIPSGQQLAKVASYHIGYLLAAHIAAKRELEDLKKRLAQLEQHETGEPAVTHRSWFPDLLSELQGVQRNCTQHDWDGDKASCVTPTTLAHALRLAMMLTRKYPKPDVDADPDGHLSFEWYVAPRRVVTASVSPDGQVYFAGLFGGNRNHGVEQLGELLPHALAANLERLFGEEGA
jgi:hypothetical protein